MYEYDGLYFMFYPVFLLLIFLNKMINNSLDCNSSMSYVVNFGDNEMLKELNGV